MDNNGSMNMRNWGFYEPTNGFRGHLGLHLMPSTADVEPLLGGRDHHHPGVMPPASGGSYNQQPHSPMEYMRGAWMNQRDNKYISIVSGSHYHHPHYTVMSETSSSQMLHQPLTSLKNEEEVSQTEEDHPNIDDENLLTKRPGDKNMKSPKPKKPKRGLRCEGDNENNGMQTVKKARVPKRTTEMVVNGVEMDLSSIPIPVCSCTGTRHQCYRWGSSGWQSACCTTSMSMYPLPMSTKRRSGRIAGRKMSLGAFRKVLEKLASESYNFSDPIDLKSHWARHGTNKFVTIR